MGTTHHKFFRGKADLAPAVLYPSRSGAGSSSDLLLRLCFFQSLADLFIGGL
jgi:hypothetical protein